MNAGICSCALMGEGAIDASCIAELTRSTSSLYRPPTQNYGLAMGFLEDVGYRNDPYPLTSKGAEWLLTRVSETRDAGIAFWQALTPYERMAVLDSKYMRLPRNHRLRIEYETGQRAALEAECDEYYRKITGRN